MDIEHRNLLQRAGETLYGPRWQSELAREIDVSDRTMRRWVAEPHTISNGVWTDIMMLLDVRSGELEQVADAIRGLLKHDHSKPAAIRYVVYSVASHNALSWGNSTLEALDRASGHLVSDGMLSTDLVVIFTTRSKDELSHFDAGRLPRDAQIVFRGANDIAQRFRET